MPKPAEDMTSVSVMVPSLDLLLNVQGDRNAQPTIQRVNGLVFSGLTFAYAGWLGPNVQGGYVDMQSGFQWLSNSTGNDATWLPIPANIQLLTVGSTSVVNCTFIHLGTTALMIDEGSQDVLVANSTFTDISGGGVYFGNVNDPNVTDVTRDDARYTITDNLFLNIPVEYRDCAVICGGYLLNSSITHNAVINASNTGVSLGWGWSVTQCCSCVSLWCALSPSRGLPCFIQVS